MLKNVLHYAKVFILRLIITLLDVAGLTAIAVVALANGVWWMFTGRTDGQQWVFKFGDELDGILGWGEKIRDKINSNQI